MRCVLGRAGDVYRKRKRGVNSGSGTAAASCGARTRCSAPGSRGGWRGAAFREAAVSGKGQDGVAGCGGWESGETPGLWVWDLASPALARPCAAFCSQFPFPLARCRVAARAGAGRGARFLAEVCAWSRGPSPRERRHRHRSGGERSRPSAA